VIILIKGTLNEATLNHRSLGFDITAKTLNIFDDNGILKNDFLLS